LLGANDGDEIEALWLLTGRSLFRRDWGSALTKHFSLEAGPLPWKSDRREIARLQAERQSIIYWAGPRFSNEVAVDSMNGKHPERWN
jgi:hypothetical protein